MGVTKLRLTRFGARNTPFFRLVAIDSRKARDDAPIEYLGTYDPMQYALDGVKEVRLRVDRIKYWLSVGAQPSDRVAYLLWRAGLTPAPPIHFTPSKLKPKKAPEEGKKSFSTATPFALAGRTAGSSSSGLLASALGAPALSSFSGLFSRPASVLNRVR